MPVIHKPASYIFKMESELNRLRISKTSILILDKGKDRFSLTDGHRSVFGRGSDLLRVLKAQPVGLGYQGFFETFKGKEGVQSFSSRRIEIHT